MAITPTQPAINISQGVEFEDWPTKTYYYDSGTGHIQGKTDGLPAMRQAVEVYLNIERLAWQIYLPQIGVHLKDLPGRDEAYIVGELPRRVTEALLVDDRITSVEDFSFTRNSKGLLVSFLVQTVYGPVESAMEVMT